MARPLATKEIVFEAADALLADGTEPSILTVQAKIGGGSYTTIKRHLDDWTAKNVIAAQAAVETPGFVLEKSAELGRTLWAMAIREANKETQAAKDAAEDKVASIGKELAFAQSEIRRMEEVEEDQNRVLERTTEQLSRAVADMTDALAKAAKVPDLEARLAIAQGDATAAHQEAKDRAIESGRLSGEAEALRNQVRELTAALVSLKAKPSSEV
ncbi:DNA-binding protein [Polaromonas aquatica]|uniref:DNA-binding protein n=1 Tax=Polaromonas aquatica TaxID=332657 RepID=A0ABW1TU76_9BURK